MVPNTGAISEIHSHAGTGGTARESGDDRTAFVSGNKIRNCAAA